MTTFQVDTNTAYNTEEVQQDQVHLWNTSCGNFYTIFHPSIATKVLVPELSNFVRRTFAYDMSERPSQTLILDFPIAQFFFVFDGLYTVHRPNERSLVVVEQEGMIELSFDFLLR